MCLCLVVVVKQNRKIITPDPRARASCELPEQVKREAIAILQDWWVAGTVVRRFREEAAGSG